MTPAQSKRELARLFTVGDGYRVRASAGVLEITRWHAPDEESLKERLVIPEAQIREIADKLRLMPTKGQLEALAHEVPRAR